MLVGVGECLVRDCLLIGAAECADCARPLQLLVVCIVFAETLVANKQPDNTTISFACIRSDQRTSLILSPWLFVRVADEAYRGQRQHKVADKFTIALLARAI